MSGSPVVRYEKSEVVVMRRGDVVDRQEQERTSDGSGSSALNRGGSTAKVQLLPLLEGSPDSDSQQQRPDRVRVPRLLDPLKLTAVATAAYGAIIFAGKRDARVNRRFFPESALVRSDDARVDPHLVAMNSFLGASFMSMGAVMGAMSFTSDRKLRRLFHFVNAAQIFFQQANGALSIFLPLATWSLALFLGGGKKKKGAGKKKGSSDHDD